MSTFCSYLSSAIDHCSSGRAQSLLNISRAMWWPIITPSEGFKAWSPSPHSKRNIPQHNQSCK